MEHRKYFLDWLRVSAFGFLILFHVGMLYVTWPFNLKSARIVPALEPWMTALGAWRLALLFFISGVAARFLITRLGPGAFARDRLRRLLPVILFAMFVVIPPQVYVEFRSKGAIAPGYLHFWLFSYLPADQTLAHHFGRTFPTWDHLWFVVYLLAYTLVLAAIFGVAQRLGRTEGRPIPLLAALLAPAAWMAVTNLFILKVAPITDAFVNDPGGHLKWAGLFAFGVVLARRDDFWTTLQTHRRWLALAAAVLLVVQTHVNDPYWSVVSGLYGWATICALCGYAAQYLNQPSVVLQYLNEAVLPVYVLHQPILLVAAYFLFPLHLPLPVEAASVVAATAAGVLVIYTFAIRPFTVSRVLFGLKPSRSAPFVPTARANARQ